jgi:tRNA (Thr-GGU) A37 N-methylase
MEASALIHQFEGVVIMENFILHPIGSVSTCDDDYKLVLDKKYVSALEGLDGFGYVQVLWWFDGCDNPEARPDIRGVFATRSPQRPNPIALTCAPVTCIDRENGVVGLGYIDANDGSPVLDIKPYTPSLDRVEHPTVPQWCAHWPRDCESSGDFNWEAEFNF